MHCKSCKCHPFFVVDAAWVKSRVGRPSLSYTNVPNRAIIQTIYTNGLAEATNCKLWGREDETDARAVRSNPLARCIEWMGFRPKTMREAPSRQRQLMMQKLIQQNMM